MTTRETWFYEDLQGRLRGLLISLGEHYSTDDTDFLSELIDANECGLALEIMFKGVAAKDVVVPQDQLTEMGRLAEDMEMTAMVQAIDAMKPH